LDTKIFGTSLDEVVTTLTSVGLKAIGALILYLFGRWLITKVISIVHGSLEKQKLDPTLLRYVSTVISALANVALVVALLGYFGVETTSFAALLAGAGIAIGTAWGGLLTNFASGAFLVVLRPYKVGDEVSAADVTGIVRAIGLFTTTIDTPDNVATHVGNGKVLGSTIKNFSTNSHRRVILTAQLHHSVNVADAIARLIAKLAAIPNVISAPAPQVEILEFSEFGPVLTVRTSTHTSNYWQVYFDMNKAIAAVGAEGAYPPAERTFKLRDVEGDRVSQVAPKKTG
jgi:small conductance mechanosensitive channel